MNDEARMTKPESKSRDFRHSDFGFLLSFDIRHSSLFSRSSLYQRARIRSHGLGQFQLLELGLDRYRVLGFGDDFFTGDHAGQVFLDQETIQRHHAIFRAGLDVRLNAERLVVANQRGNRRRVDHDFKNGDAARHVHARKEQLRDDRLQNRRKLDADLLLLVRGKSIDDTVNGFRRAGGVEGAEDQVAGFGGGDGSIDRFQIAHFADEDHVRVLAQYAAQRFGKIRHVHADFALGHQRLFVPVIIFDGIFDGDEVDLVALFINDVEHRGERRGLARTGRARDQDEPSWFVEQLLGRGRQANLLHR